MEDQKKPRGLEAKPVGNASNNGDNQPFNETAAQNIGCSIKSVPTRLLHTAARTAAKVNPVNAPVFGPTAEAGSDVVLEPLALTLTISKYWGPLPRKLTVSFMESTPADLRKRIVQHMNAWNKTAGISFLETSGIGNVRISRGAGGYWSYLGTDILLIPLNRPTMNLQGFTMNTPESEYKRVVRHETGHTLGFPHEHMRRELVNRIDPQKAYAYFLATQGWNKQTVDQQVLTPLGDATIFGTAADQTSIMCYQLPGSITKDGLPIVGGKDINTTDYNFAGQIYPKLFWPFSSNQAQLAQEVLWDEEEDVSDDHIDVLIKETLAKSSAMEMAG
jgi:hypothetical protein